MRRRGLLIPCLLLLTLMLVLCLAQIGKQPFHYQAARGAVLAAQGRALAEAGLEDFRCKWGRDSQFPLSPPAGTSYFTYLEEVWDPVSWERLGAYRVSCDTRYRSAPYQILLVRSEGLLGQGSEVSCAYSIEAVLDDSDGPRPNGPSQLGQWLEWRELPPSTPF